MENPLKKRPQELEETGLSDKEKLIVARNDLVIKLGQIEADSEKFKTIQLEINQIDEKIEQIRREEICEACDNDNPIECGNCGNF